MEAPSASRSLPFSSQARWKNWSRFRPRFRRAASKPDDYFDIPDTYDVAGSIFSDAWAHPTLDWSISNIIAHSSDIGTIEIAQRLGLPRLVQYIHDFGIGEPTDVNFPGESRRSWYQRRRSGRGRP